MRVEKIYCDKCEKIIKDNVFTITIMAGTNLKTFTPKDIEVCESCFQTIRRTLGIEEWDE